MDKIRILVVDDESRMRKLVRDFLVREGYEVLTEHLGIAVNIEVRRETARKPSIYFTGKKTLR